MLVSLSTYPCKGKPTPRDVQIISRDIAKNIVCLSPKTLAKKLVRGYTCCPPVFIGGRRKNINFKQTQLIMQDVDNEGKKKESHMTFEEAFAYLKYYNLEPTFAYTTFSNKPEQPRYRLAWVLPHPIKDIRFQKLVQKTILWLFPSGSACPSSANGPHMPFYNGKKILHSNYKATLDLQELFKAVYTITYDSDIDGKHVKERVASYCRKMGIRMLDGLPAVRFEPLSEAKRQEGPMPKTGEMSSGGKYIYYYSPDGKTPISGVGLQTFVYGDQLVYIWFQNDEDFDMHTEYAGAIQHFDLVGLKGKCQLWAEFCDNTRILRHYELFPIFTNMAKIEGGVAAFNDNINKNRSYYIDGRHWKKSDESYALKANYTPYNCINFCEYADTCKHAANIVETGK